MVIDELSPGEGPVPATGTRRRAGSTLDAIDGVAPDVVFSPDTTADVVSIVEECRSSGRAIIATGGATLLELGNVPRRFEVRLDLLRLSQTIEHSPKDMVVTVAASVSLARLNEQLADAGQRVALTATEPQRATIGGLAASDFSGPLAYGFGSPRDQILGMTVVDGCGRRLRLGGRVVKNVAGYDLPRLFIGSCGTLGVITELTLRTHPCPEKSRSARIDYFDWDSLDAARAALFASNLPLSAIDTEVESCAGSHRWSLEILIEGTASEVSYQEDRVEQLCGGRLTEVVREPSESRAIPEQAPVVVRTSGRPAYGIRLAADLVREADTHGMDCRINAESAGARLRWAVDCRRTEDCTPLIALAQGLATRYGATAVVERMPSREKRAVDIWGPVPVGFDIMKRLKRRFDPDEIFAPGRFVGGL